MNSTAQSTSPTPQSVVVRNPSSSSSTSSSIGHIINQRRMKTTYAEWITKAILSSSSKSLALAEINEWMATNVPGLKDQKFLHSSQGWKNAVRHTLSVNRGRFEKMPREGRPSLWTLTEKYGRSYVDSEMVRDFSSCISTSRSTDDDIGVIRKVGSCDSNDKRMDLSKQSKSSPRYQASDDKMDHSSTQTIQVVFSDGVVAAVVLPKPLPVCGYTNTHEQSLMNTLGALAGMKPLWDDNQQTAFLNQALLKHRYALQAQQPQSVYPITSCSS